MRRRCRRGTRRVAARGAHLAALALALALAGPPAQATAPCEPWPGEPEGPPTSRDADRFRAQWAVRRARELASFAAELEASSRSLAQPLWRHAACLDPRRGDFADRARAAAPVRIHRPPILQADHSHGFVPLAELDEPLVMPRGAMVSPLLQAARASERRAAAALRDASFEEVLSWAAHGRSLLAAASATPEGEGLRARLEVLAATAALALGDESGARASLQAALVAQPELALDPARVSPKVVRLLASVRGEMERAP